MPCRFGSCALSVSCTVSNALLLSHAIVDSVTDSTIACDKSNAFDTVQETDNAHDPNLHGITEHSCCDLSVISNQHFLNVRDSLSGDCIGQDLIHEQNDHSNTSV